MFHTNEYCFFFFAFQIAETVTLIFEHEWMNFKYFHMPKMIKADDHIVIWALEVAIIIWDGKIMGVFLPNQMR